MKLSIIVAMAKNGVIGREGDLPWRLSADLQRFKQLTMGHAILMGRRTFDSIGRALPGRTSIVISRSPSGITTGNHVLAAGSLEEAVRLIGSTEMEQDEAFVIGGAEIYRIALPQANRLYVTQVDSEVEGDTHFPNVEWQNWNRVSSEEHKADSKNEFPYRFELFERA